MRALVIAALCAMTLAGSAGAEPSSDPFAVDSRQARQVALVARLVEALNEARPLVALSLFDDGSATVGGCPDALSGTREIEQWIRRLIVDDTPLTLRSIRGDTADASAVFVEWHGTIDAAKVVFTTDGPLRIQTLTCMPRSAPPDPARFAVDANQARQIDVVVRFLDAYNAGRVREALAQFRATDDRAQRPRLPFAGDCDYAHNTSDGAFGRRGIGAWLRKRVADHDRLTLGSIRNDTHDTRVLLVLYARRTSDTLRRLGFPRGVAPAHGAKVVFTPTRRTRIVGWGGGGSHEACTPR
jgi:hypothetical protein